jgi:hypothetical protein
MDVSTLAVPKIVKTHGMPPPSDHHRHSSIGAPIVTSNPTSLKLVVVVDIGGDHHALIGYYDYVHAANRWRIPATSTCLLCWQGHLFPT